MLEHFLDGCVPVNLIPEVAAILSHVCQTGRPSQIPQGRQDGGDEGEEDAVRAGLPSEFLHSLLLIAWWPLSVGSTEGIRKL